MTCVCVCHKNIKMNPEVDKPSVKWFPGKTIKTDKVARSTFYARKYRMSTQLTAMLQGYSKWLLRCCLAQTRKRPCSTFVGRSLVSPSMQMLWNFWGGTVIYICTVRDEMHSTDSCVSSNHQVWEAVGVMLVSAHWTNKMRKLRTGMRDKRINRH